MTNVHVTEFFSVDVEALRSGSAAIIACAEGIDNIAKDLLDFKDSMLQGQVTGGTITSRQNLHAISWHSFFQNPFFGTSAVGGHSSFIDRLGGMGFIAGLPFVMIFVSFIKRMVKLYETKMAKAFFWIGTISAFLFLYQKGNWGAEAWLIYMVLMPMGISVFEQSNNHD